MQSDVRRVKFMITVRYWPYLPDIKFCLLLWTHRRFQLRISRASDAPLFVFSLDLHSWIMGWQGEPRVPFFCNTWRGSLDCHVVASCACVRRNRLSSAYEEYTLITVVWFLSIILKTCMDCFYASTNGSWRDAFVHGPHRSGKHRPTLFSFFGLI